MNDKQWKYPISRLFGLFTILLAKLHGVVDDGDVVVMVVSSCDKI